VGGLEIDRRATDIAGQRIFSDQHSDELLGVLAAGGAANAQEGQIGSREGHTESPPERRYRNITNRAHRKFRRRRRSGIATPLTRHEGSFTDAFGPANTHVGRILKDETPAEPSVQQITKIELIINMNAAKALGLTVLLPLLGRADQVIE
jgi:hypothetical protein